MGRTKNFLTDFSNFMDQNIRGVQYGLYSTALVGLAIALRSVRPFKKFTTPQSLPISFIQKHVKLRGRVVGVDPPGLLQVEHRPIFTVWPRKSEPLPVGVDSIRVMGHGTSWLQTIVNGEEIVFSPVTADPDALSCVVIRKGKNVGVQLVSLGMATVQPLHYNLKDDVLYKQYYKQLLQAEAKAGKKKLGLWADTPSGPSLLSKTMLKSVQLIQKGFSKAKITPLKA